MPYTRLHHGHSILITIVDTILSLIEPQVGSLQSPLLHGLFPHNPEGEESIRSHHCSSQFKPKATGFIDGLLQSHQL